MTEVEIIVSVSTYGTPIFAQEIKVEDSSSGVCAALLGWNKQIHDEAQALYKQDFGPLDEETNVRMEVEIKDNGDTVFEEFVDITGQRYLVIHGVQGVEFALFKSVNDFLASTYN